MFDRCFDHRQRYEGRESLSVCGLGQLPISGAFLNSHGGACKLGGGVGGVPLVTLSLGGAEGGLAPVRVHSQVGAQLGPGWYAVDGLQLGACV